MLGALPSAILAGLFVAMPGNSACDRIRSDAVYERCVDDLDRDYSRAFLWLYAGSAVVIASWLSKENY